MDSPGVGGDNLHIGDDFDSTPSHLGGMLKAWRKVSRPHPSVSGRNTRFLDLEIGGTPVRDRIMGISLGSKNAYATPLNVASILRTTMSFREGPEQQRRAISTMRVRERWRTRSVIAQSPETLSISLGPPLFSFMGRR